MVEYKPTQYDVETGLQETGVVLIKKTSTGWMWKLSAVLSFFALCVGVLLLLAWFCNGRPDIMMQSGKTEALVGRDTAGEREPHRMLRRMSSKAKAAIHLEGSYEDNRGSGAQLQWKSGQGQAFAQGGFQLDNNKIIVPATGLYFVYSQASFRVSCGEREEARKTLMPLSHRIWCFSDSVGSEASLMSAVRSACQAQQGMPENKRQSEMGWYNAIYLGAAFQLQKGDILWTETNQLSELETDEGRTFFGVFAL